MLWCITSFRSLHGISFNRKRISIIPYADAFFNMTGTLAVLSQFRDGSNSQSSMDWACGSFVKIRYGSIWLALAVSMRLKGRAEAIQIGASNHYHRSQ